MNNTIGLLQKRLHNLPLIIVHQIGNMQHYDEPGLHGNKVELRTFFQHASVPISPGMSPSEHYTIKNTVDMFFRV